MTGEVARVIVDVLVIASLAATTAAVVGMRRTPDLYNQLHVAGTVPFLGLTPLALALAASGEVWLLLKAILVVGFLLLTGGVTAHVIARMHRAEQTGRGARAGRR